MGGGGWPQAGGGGVGGRKLVGGGEGGEGVGGGGAGGCGHALAAFSKHLCLEPCEWEGQQSGGDGEGGRSTVWVVGVVRALSVMGGGEGGEGAVWVEAVWVAASFLNT